MLKKKKIFWQLFPSYLLIIFISLFLVTTYSSNLFTHFYQEQILIELKERAYLIENQISKDFYPLNVDNIRVLTDKISKKILTRITIILPSGEVVADTEEDPLSMDNHTNRPEIQMALSGKDGFSTRFSHTLKENMVYVTVPVYVNNKMTGIIRTAMPSTLIEKTLTKAYFEIILGGLLVAFIGGAINYNLSKKISQPLEQLEHKARGFAAGNLKERLPEFDLEEINNVAYSMNEMAEQLNERMQIITHQNAEQETILSSMKSGLIFIDPQKRITKLNTSAAKLLNLDIEEVYGKKVKDTIKNIEFYKFISRALENRKSIEKEIPLGNDKEKHCIQLYTVPIFDEKEARTGTLIVLNDITHIKRLETIRQDFVSNVSHELKTPITSIQGYVETLIDGDMNDPEEIKTYLGVIKKHTGRLKAIIEDLLSLSRIEQGASGSEVTFETINIRDVLTNAVQTCEQKAELKSIKMNLACNNELKCSVNPLLIEQAIINLIDNAVKYSEESSSVLVEAFRQPGEIVIKVRDHGCGIPEESLSRIFERFYRVDKARSRKQGGTGLGLSIVKHIVQIHKGQVDVKSKPGEGSCFYIHLPEPA